MQKKIKLVGLFVTVFSLAYAGLASAREVKICLGYFAYGPCTTHCVYTDPAGVTHIENTPAGDEVGPIMKDIKPGTAVDYSIDCKFDGKEMSEAWDRNPINQSTAVACYVAGGNEVKGCREVQWGVCSGQELQD